MQMNSLVGDTVDFFSAFVEEASFESIKQIFHHFCLPLSLYFLDLRLNQVEPSYLFCN